MGPSILEEDGEKEVKVKAEDKAKRLLQRKTVKKREKREARKKVRVKKPKLIMEFNGSPMEIPLEVYE